MDYYRCCASESVDPQTVQYYTKDGALELIECYFLQEDYSQLRDIYLDMYESDPRSDRDTLDDDEFIRRCFPIYGLPYIHSVESDKPLMEFYIYNESRKRWIPGFIRTEH